MVYHCMPRETCISFRGSSEQFCTLVMSARARLSQHCIKFLRNFMTIYVKKKHYTYMYHFGKPLIVVTATLLVEKKKEKTIQKSQTKTSVF